MHQFTPLRYLALPNLLWLALLAPVTRVAKAIELPAPLFRAGAAIVDVTPTQFPVRVTAHWQAAGIGTVAESESD